jgi:hypothetical protein
MDCETCGDLIAAYECSVKLYTEPMQDMAELAEDDFQLALEGLERLRVKCREARDALVEHWHQDHR